MSRTFTSLSTPAVIVSRSTLSRNIESMASFASSRNLALRPHAKTHKMVELAHLQLAAGAVGLSVATVGEAKTFVDAGIDDVFIAYPLWVSSDQAQVLSDLMNRATISVGTDSAEAVRNLAEQLGNEKQKISVRIEINSGHHRSGVLPKAALGIAHAIVESGMNFQGVFTFPGHSYAPDQPEVAAADESKVLIEAVHYLKEAGFDVPVVSGGSTPTAKLTRPGVVNEIRPGVYVFGDAQQLELGRINWDEIALSVLTTVVSSHEGNGSPRRIVVDAGSKVLGGDRPPWTTGFGRVLGCPDARITALSEHHGTIVWPENEALPRVGERLEVIPNHVCVAVNLVDQVTVVEKEEVFETWEVAARGMNS